MGPAELPSFPFHATAELFYTNPQTLGNMKIGERKPKVGGNPCSDIT